MRITLGKIVACVIIIVMVAGFRELDQEGFFTNPLDKAPTVEFDR